MSNMNITVVDQVASALSLASLRNQVIASNIAHRDTEGYQRLKVRFEEAFGATMHETSLSESAAREAPRARAVIALDHASVTPSVEEDMIDLSSNTLNYQALTRALSRYFSIAEIIANGGRN
jgi:flagellar basal-body rod protein FlgB